MIHRHINWGKKSVLNCKARAVERKKGCFLAIVIDGLGASYVLQVISRYTPLQHVILVERGHSKNLLHTVLCHSQAGDEPGLFSHSTTLAGSETPRFPQEQHKLKQIEKSFKRNHEEGKNQ